jgi:hypothetical protein
VGPTIATRNGTNSRNPVYQIVIAKNRFGIAEPLRREVDGVFRMHERCKIDGRRDCK